MTSLETETRLHIHADQGGVVAVRGNELAPEDFSAPNAVVFVRSGGAWLNREDAAKLGRFLLEVVP